MTNAPISNPVPPGLRTNGKVMLDALTGLRFVAALGVFVHHFSHVSGVEFAGPAGNASVTFFFVLSGFILSIAYGSGVPKPSRGRFYWARFARIWPLHVACLVVWFAVHRPNPLPYLATDIPEVLKRLALVQSWSVDESRILDYNGVSWSLSVEAFLYAVFPLLCG